MTGLHIDLLGPPRFYINDREVILTRNKSIALMAYLSNREQYSFRSDLVDLLWPESDSHHGFGSLRTVLSEIKSKFGEHIIEAESKTVCLSKDYVKCTTKIFRAWANSAANLDSLRKSADLWNGGFLKGFALKNCLRYSDWQFLEEQNLEIEYKGLLKKITIELSKNNLHEEAIHYAHERLKLDVYDEETHRDLMQLYAETGNKSAALQQFKLCMKSLETDLGFPVEDETRILAEQIRKGIVGNNRKIGFHKAHQLDRGLPRLIILPLAFQGVKETDQPDICDIAGEAMTDFSSSVPGLEVISRTSSLAYRNTNKSISRIAAELHIDYLIEGRISNKSESFFIEGRLINASRDSIVCSKKIRVVNTLDITVLAREITADLLSELGIDIHTEEEMNPDPGVQWRLYGNSLVRDSEVKSMDLAIESYYRALDLNPNDSNSWAGIANALLCKCNGGILGAEVANLYVEAETAVTKTLVIDPDNAMAISVQGAIAEERDWDYQRAERLYNKALSIDPSNPMVYVSLSFLYARMNKLNESRDMGLRAYELNPVNMWTISARFWSLVASGLYRKAQHSLDESKKFFPHPTWNAFDRALMQILIGNYKNAIPILEKVKSDMIKEEKHTLLGTLAYAYAKSGKVEKALKLIDELSHERNKFIGFHLPFAAVYTAMGDYSKAISWLEKAVESRDPGILTLALLPYYKPLYKLGAFKSVLEKVNIAPRD